MAKPCPNRQQIKTIEISFKRKANKYKSHCKYLPQRNTLSFAGLERGAVCFLVSANKHCHICTCIEHGRMKCETFVVSYICTLNMVRWNVKNGKLHMCWEWGRRSKLKIPIWVHAERKRSCWTHSWTVSRHFPSWWQNFGWGQLKIKRCLTYSLT